MQGRNVSENVVMTSRPFILKIHRREAEGAELSFFLCRAAERPARHKKHPSGSFPPPPHALGRFRFRTGSQSFSEDAFLGRFGEIG